MTALFRGSLPQLHDPKSIAGPLRRLADAFEAGTAEIEELSISNDLVYTDSPNAPGVHDLVFMGQRVTLMVTSRRNIFGGG